MDKLFKDIKEILNITKPTLIDFSKYFNDKNIGCSGRIDRNKNNAVNHTFEFLMEKLAIENKFPWEGFYFLYGMEFQSGYHVEIFAKALFQFIYYRKERGKNEPLYIAVDFKNQDFAREFIRIFSIFYIKNDQNKISSYMTNVQIAVSSTSEKTGLKEVNFVLAGESLANAYATAKNFVYYNSDASLSFVPLLKFLSVGSEASPEPLFPFDLYLVDDSGKSWFKKQMQHRLKTDLRTEEYGCKISNVKVRLGSKIHVDTFYEAELLLHNVGTVKRFAYLLAKEIIKDIKEKGDVFVNDLECGKRYLFLLGYENYSAVLMQEVYRLIKDCYGDESKIEWLIDTRSEDFPVLSFDKLTVYERKEIFEEESIYCITILPLSSTMSTVYKLHESFERGLEKIKKELKAKKEPKVNFLNNYCLVTIGDVFDKASLEGNKIAEKYLKAFESEDFCGWQSVTLKKQKHYDKEGNENQNTENETKVKYLFSAVASWENLGELENRGNQENSKNNKPLLKVDKTSTLLDAYFQTSLRKDVVGYYNQESNVEYLDPNSNKESEKKSEKTDKDHEKYCSYVKYGHILRGDNHYQFYFDFEKLTEKRKNDIEKWARKMGELIEADAYNIVISPLQITNASFLDIILNETFGSNLHLLHINILGTGKENVRTKFEYIAHEFFRITQQSEKINFYYVDDSVCTGNGLARAWKFLITLCNQSGVDIKKLCPDGEKFKKVFLLINRSSYETAQTWVKNPNKDWRGFINLCVPSYNTHMENNIATCPGCRVQARYDLLRKRSATNKLVAFFNNHAKKHLARNPKDYDLWIEDQILNSLSYFEWLRVWLWFKERKGTVFNLIKKFMKSDTKENSIKGLLGWIDGRWIQIEKIHPKNAHDEKWTEKKEKIKRNIIQKLKFIIAIDNYVRLETMDAAYRELLYDKGLQVAFDVCRYKVDFAEYKDKLREKIVKLLAGCFNKGNSYDETFKFISFIKVISRDYLAKNYFIREAMYNVLRYLYAIMALLPKEIITEIQAAYKSNKNKYKESLNKFLTYIRSYITKQKDKSEKSKSTILSLLIDFLKFIEVLGDNRDEKIKKGNAEIDNWLKIISNIRNKKNSSPQMEAVFQYRIFKVVTHRLALMRSDEIILTETILSTYRALYSMTKDEEIKEDEREKAKNDSKKQAKLEDKKNKLAFLTLPDERDMILSHIASIKTATMEENNDIICYMLWEQTRKLETGEKN